MSEQVSKSQLCIRLGFSMTGVARHTGAGTSKVSSSAGGRSETNVYAAENAAWHHQVTPLAQCRRLLAHLSYIAKAPTCMIACWPDPP